MSSEEWVHWEALNMIDPIGPEVERFLLGRILAHQWNLNVDTEKHGQKEPGDFLPYLGTRKATLDEVDAGNIRIDPRIAAIRKRLQEQ